MSAGASLDERRRRVAESLLVGNPGNNARNLVDASELQCESQIELSIDEIHPYENNPRRAANAKFDDIKESIRTSGLRTPLTVTRRPGEAHFIVEAGGNTRLRALRELWSETHDSRFHKLVVLFRPWRSESHVLTSHLIENEQRGEMTFWDKACGIVGLKARLEAEQDRSLSLRPLEDALHALGLSVNTATLALQLFATERLRTLGEALTGLCGLDVKTIQPRLNALKRYAQARTSITEDELYARVFEPVFGQFTQQGAQRMPFSVAAVCEACEVALAQHLEEPVERLRAVLKPAAARAAQAHAATDTMTDVAGADVGDVERADRQDRTALVDPSAHDELLVRAQRFAGTAGLGDALRREPKSATGLRLSPPRTEDRSPPERERAWWLLASLFDELDAEIPAPPSVDSGFVRWLTDPEDESAAAFWELLASARRIACALHESRVTDRSDRTSEPA
jgi:ParB family protein of integrating conjugative element (PFGI_1 class)